VVEAEAETGDKTGFDEGDGARKLENNGGSAEKKKGGTKFSLSFSFSSLFSYLYHCY
jgi:hypothetical protein